MLCIAAAMTVRENLPGRVDRRQDEDKDDDVDTGLVTREVTVVSRHVTDKCVTATGVVQLVCLAGHTNGKD